MMDKEHQPDSMATVTIKPEYAPSEPSVYGSEPPPAYPRTQSSSVQVAKIIAVTIVLVSVVLGSFLLASAYVTANASCRQLEQELELLSEAADRFQASAPLQPEALVQDNSQKKDAEPLESEASQKKTNQIDDNNVDSSSDSDSSSNSEEEDRTPIHFKLPLQLDFDDIAGALIDKNQRSRMNCIVEKKRAEQVVDHQPKTLRLPFGLNLTTDPKYEHISGERMAIFCESGNVQRNALPEDNNNNSDEDDDDDGETIMIQPVMIPIPQSHFPTHMAQRMPQQQQQQQQPQLYQHLHPMETMRPPMPPMPQQQNQFPPTSILQHIAQQIISQKIMEAQRAREEEQTQEASNQQPEPERRFPATEDMMMAQRIPIPEELISQLNRLPNRDVIVAVQQEQEPEEISEEMQSNPQEMRVPQMRLIPQEMRSQQPQIVHIEPQEMRAVPQDLHILHQEMRVAQEPRQNAQEMNGRQTYARGLPVNIPVHMIHEEQQEVVPSEDARPHHLQPRSVRSVDALLPKTQKRVKRCSCDCAC